MFVRHWLRRRDTMRNSLSGIDSMAIVSPAGSCSTLSLMTSTATPPRTPSAPTRRPWYRNRLFVGLAIAALVLVAAGAGGIWWFLRDDAPDAVDLESATQSLEAASANSAATGAEATVGTEAASATASAVSGSWAVNTSIGEFSYEDSTGTFVGFRVEEELSSIGSATAVGRTPTVTGTITFDGTALNATTIEADMSAITTNDNRRDDNVQSALETSEFPDCHVHADGADRPRRPDHVHGLRRRVHDRLIALRILTSGTAAPPLEFSACSIGSNPYASYSGRPDIVAISSIDAKPSAPAAASHSDRISRPTPRLAKSGLVYIARTRAASAAGSSSAESRPAE